MAQASDSPSLPQGVSLPPRSRGALRRLVRGPYDAHDADSPPWPRCWTIGSRTVFTAFEIAVAAYISTIDKLAKSRGDTRLDLSTPIMGVAFALAIDALILVVALLGWYGAGAAGVAGFADLIPAITSLVGVIGLAGHGLGSSYGPDHPDVWRSERNNVMLLTLVVWPNSVKSKKREAGDGTLSEARAAAAIAAAADATDTEMTARSTDWEP
ncbi:hypothetical protein MFIFM68171_11198 [Madurella fahalii]|uniref:Integral membrane protein n=1 Tax=Madurella fahalii TaxID=1157608 RepID=A0ABQ0GTB8_9PEZI